MYRYETTTTLRPELCGPDGRLSPAGLANLFQEAAWNSAAELGASTPRLHQDGLTWVLYRLQVEADAWPVQNETIRLSTWPSGRERMMVLRDYRIETAGKEIIRAKSFWLIFNLAKRRLAPAPPYVESALGSIKTPPGFSPGFTPPPLPETYPISQPIFPRVEDQDLNGHISHVKLMAWAFLPMPQRQDRLAAFDISFKKEVLPQDSLKSEVAPLSHSIAHRLLRMSNAEVLVSGYSLWS